MQTEATLSEYAPNLPPDSADAIEQGLIDVPQLSTRGSSKTLRRLVF